MPTSRNVAVHAPYSAVRGCCARYRCPCRTTRTRQYHTRIWLRLALSKALVTNERTLLVANANEATKRHALEGPVRQISVHLARRDVMRQNQIPYAEILPKDTTPLECGDVEQKPQRWIAHFDHGSGGWRRAYAIQDLMAPNARLSARALCGHPPNYRSMEG